MDNQVEGTKTKPLESSEEFQNLREILKDHDLIEINYTYSKNCVISVTCSPLKVFKLNIHSMKEEELNSGVELIIGYYLLMKTRS